MSDAKEEPPHRETTPVRQLSMRLGHSFSRHLDSHVHAIRKMEDKRITTHKWIEEAITEKLERERHLSPADFGREKRLALKLKPDIHQAIDEQVEGLKKLRATYSKTRWIFEAMIEKLEKEERRVWKWAEGLKNETSDSTDSTSH